MSIASPIISFVIAEFCAGALLKVTKVGDMTYSLLWQITK